MQTHYFHWGDGRVVKKPSTLGFRTWLQPAHKQSNTDATRGVSGMEIARAPRTIEEAEKYPKKSFTNVCEGVGPYY